MATLSGVRCEGGFVTPDQEKVTGSAPGWWRADCPSCGQRIAFHWVTGKFRAHNTEGR